jgi:hypothetical protein
VNVQHQDHWRRLRTVVDQFVAQPDLHNRPPLDLGLTRLGTWSGLRSSFSSI